MSRIIVTRNVKEYRQTISHVVTARDIVLEIGCATGTTSALLHRVGETVVGIDKGASLPVARARFPDVRFEQIDGFNIAQVLALGYAFTVIYIDISGCRDVYDVIAMISKYEAVFQPKVIVVKSTKLKYLVSKCTVWEEGAAEP